MLVALATCAQLLMTSFCLSISIKKSLSSSNLDVCTAVVELEDNAIAKSHRPTDIFNERTCPFFGDAGYGNMLIEVHSSGLNKLEREIYSINCVFR